MLLDDRLREHKHIFRSIELHMPSKNQVLVEVAGQDKDGRQIYLTNKAIDCMLA